MEEREFRTTFMVIGIDNYICEKCWFKIKIQDIGDWNYCPKCGALIDSWQEYYEN